MARRATVGTAILAVAVGATAAFVLLARSGPVAADTASAGSGLVVYGYPYADDCPAAGIVDAVDRWKMDECNCTSYVAWALQANGQRTDWFVPGAMDAWNWPHVAQLAGIRVGRTPRLGAVAVWPRLERPFGHVAYVTALGPGGRFSVSEYNEPDLEPYVFDRRDGVSAAGAIFIYVPKR